MVEKKLILTEDGSHSCFLPDYGESYHSKHGAIQESRHVFIDNGLKMIHKNEIKVFEMGFGSGLNALLSLEFARYEKIRVQYDAIELHPVSVAEAGAFNYASLLNMDNNDFMSLHNCPWGSRFQIPDYFSLLKIETDLLEFTPFERYDLVYFDAFSAEVQPELWKKPIFIKLYNAMNPGSILSTYSARGELRRTLAEVGFRVEKIAGPPGKRHITRAIKD